MNQYPGTIGRKLGMTQLFDPDGTLVSVTVIEAPAVVVGKRTPEKDGYSALILGLGERKEKRTSKPLRGFYKKNGQTPKTILRELRMAPEIAAPFEIGQKVPLEQVFSPGQYVDVRGRTRGRGFTGVIRRHNFAGWVSTHGTHEYKRHGGSIGTNMTPGRTLPGVRMPGHYGDEKVTIHNLRVFQVVTDKDLLLLRGAVPGPRDRVVEVRGATKKRGGKKAPGPAGT